MSFNYLCKVRIAFLVMLLGLTAPNALAQTITVKGVVTDATYNEPVIGATVVLVEDTSKGMLTSLDGEFTLTGVPKNGTIRVSYVGYKTIEVPINGQTTLNIVIQEDNELLDEVVVTALGIKRSEKALSYNVQELKGEALNKLADANFVNNLNGKVAGVTINSSSAGMGSASKVVMRGTKSIDGNNNALYVIDGVPIFSTTTKQGSGQFDSNGSTEGAADINPNDIESISVLTGASAAALYGSAAANGAILITTKKGASGKPRVTFSTNNDWGVPMWLPEFQYRYGSDGRQTSWGSPIGNQCDGYYRIEDFLQTAFNTNNSVSVSGGSDRNQTYLSVSTTNSWGLVPNNRYERYNFTARNTSSLLEDRLSIGLSTSYIIQKHNNMVNQGEYMNPLASAYLMPRSEHTDNVKNFEQFDADRNIYVQNWRYGAGEYTLQNPFWVAYRNLRHSKRERYMLSATVAYDLMKWNEAEKWNIQGRVRSDVTNGLATDSRYATTEKINVESAKNGYYGEEKSTDRQTYADVLSTFNKSFELGSQRLNINATLGASIQDTRFESSTVRGPLRDAGAANLFNTFNIDQNHEKSVAFPEGWIEQTQSIFGSLELGLNSYLFLTVTGRNDWASQLANSPHKSFFYPSVGLSGVITDMLSADTKTKISPVLGYLQVRASFSSVASPFQRGLTTPTLVKDFKTKGYSDLTHFPVGELYPERTDSYEVGFSSKWFSNRFTLDMTYYLTDTKNQTFFVTVPAGSGYSGMYLQTGMVRNQGIELAAGLHLGNNDGWAFNSNLTLGYNHNEIKELAENYTNPITKEKESKEFLEIGALGIKYVLQKGGTLGDIYTEQDFSRDSRGDIILNADGSLGIRGLDAKERVKLGSVLPKVNAGWSNEISYKGLAVGATLTGRFGGVVVSMTQAALDNYGVSERTAAARDRGYVQDGNIFMNPERFFTTIGSKRMAQYYTYDATNIRIQEAHIAYNLPRKWFNDAVGVHLSLFGRNLAFLYNKAPFDPEAVSSTGNYSQGLDYFMMPTQTSFGFNVKVDF